MTDLDRDTTNDRAHGDIADRVIRRDIRPRWVAEVNRAMDLPLPEAREVIAGVIAQRRQRAAELRASAARGDVSDRYRSACLGAAEQADDSVRVIEHIVQRLAELDAAAEVATGREQIRHELTQGGERSRGRPL